MASHFQWEITLFKVYKASFFSFSPLLTPVYAFSLTSESLRTCIFKIRCTSNFFVLVFCLESTKKVFSSIAV